MNDFFPEVLPSEDRAFSRAQRLADARAAATPTCRAANANAVVAPSYAFAAPDRRVMAASDKVVVHV